MVTDDIQIAQPTLPFIKDAIDKAQKQIMEDVGEDSAVEPTIWFSMPDGKVSNFSIPGPYFETHKQVVITSLQGMVRQYKPTAYMLVFSAYVTNIPAEKVSDIPTDTEPGDIMKKLHERPDYKALLEQYKQETVFLQLVDRTNPESEKRYIAQMPVIRDILGLVNGLANPVWFDTTEANDGTTKVKSVRGQLVI